MMVVAKAYLPTLLAGNIQAVLNAGTYRLFSNNYTPVVATMVLASLTQNTFPGYAAKTPVFAAPALNVVTGEMSAPALQWDCTGGVGENVYGYYALDAGGALILAERSSFAPVLMTNGVSYIVVPYFSDINQ